MNKFTGIGIKDLKKINTNFMKKLIWESNGISRTEIAEKLGLSPAAITSLCEELIKQNIIREVEIGESTGGRRPILLKFNPDKAYIIGIMVNKKYIEYYIYNLDKDLKNIKKINISEEILVQNLYENITQNIEELINKSSISHETILGIGLTFDDEFELLNSDVLLDTGISMGRMNIEDALSFKFKKPVYIINNVDSKIASIISMKNNYKKEDFILIDIKDEIKMSSVKNEIIIENNTKEKSDIGHMIIDRNGPKCKCGKKGCLKAYASNSAIIKKIMISSIEENIFDNSSNINIKKMSIEDIIGQGNKGNAFINKTFKEVSEILAIAISNIQQLLNIKNIAITGDIVYYEKLISNLEEACNKYNKEINISGFKNDVIDCKKGQCYIVIQKYFNNPFQLMN